MTTEELDHLDALAVAATPGPWVYQGKPSDALNDPDVLAGEQWVCSTSYDALSTSRGDRDYHADAHFIAAANPVVVRSLIAEVRRLRFMLSSTVNAYEAGIIEPATEPQQRQERREDVRRMVDGL